MEIHEYASGPTEWTPRVRETGAATAEFLRSELEKIGRFARSGDGGLFYNRYADGRWYRVSSKPGGPFARFVAGLFRRDARHRSTREALDHLYEQLRDRAALLYVELESNPDGEIVRPEPLHFAKKKHKGSRRRSKHLTFRVPAR